MQHINTQYIRKWCHHDWYFAINSYQDWKETETGQIYQWMFLKSHIMFFLVVLDDVELGMRNYKVVMHVTT